MKCIVCGTPTHDWFGDAWCDECNGVPYRTGDGHDRLLFRHVANVRGTEYGLPVAWDESAKHYMFRWPNTVNPRFKKKRTGVDKEFRPTPVLTTFGTLDVVLAQALAVVRKACTGDDIPELSVAPSATEEERQLVGV